MKAKLPSNGRARKRHPVEDPAARNLALTRTLQIVEEARANLADQYDFAPIGFVTLDAKGCVREMNLTAARMLGRERDALLSAPFFTQIARSHCKEFLDHLSECRRRQAEVVTDIALRSRDRKAVHVEMRSVPVIDPRGRGIVYRTALTDIAGRLRTENALRESERRYRDLIELSPDAIFIQSDGAIVFANGSALRLCGAGTVGEVIGREIVELARPAFRRAVKALLDQASAMRDAPGGEARFVRFNGEIVDVELVARAFRHEGEAAVLVVARDITRRKAAERHALTISENERTRFGRDLHDSLSQNLMGVSWRAEALRNQLRAKSPDAAAEADEIARMIRHCMNEARNLARGLCPVAMEQSGLVAALHELAAEVAGRARIGCALECDESLTIRDIGVATNVYRIAQEAVANAIKHGKARSVLIQLASDNGRTLLRVRDDGGGFQPKPRQTGMGLHTMRYRASVIGGSLDVRRDGQSGTVVTCSFPTEGEPL